MSDKKNITEILQKMDLRTLQKECARAQCVLDWDKISHLSSKTKYDSRQYYKKVIELYYEEYGDLPSNVGPGKDIKLLYE